jgi:hypothetical protein
MKAVLLQGGTGRMTAGELITMINLDTNEILDDSAEYIPYINAAIDCLVMILVPMKDREVVKSMDINNNNPVPGDFTAFIPTAGYPVRIVNGSFQTYGGKTVNNVFYAVKKPHISDETDSIPFSEIFHFVLVQLVSFLVKKKSLMLDYASADKAFIADLTTAIQAARGR